MTVSSGGTAENMTISFGGILYVSPDGILCGQVVLGGMMELEERVNASNADIMFDVTQRTVSDAVIVNDITMLNGGIYSVNVSSDQAEGRYKLAGNAADFSQTVTLTVKDTALSAALAKDTATVVGGKDYTLAVVDGELCLGVEAHVYPAPENLAGDGAGLSWSAVDGASGYVVEYSRDGFSTCVSVETATAGLEHYNVGAGTWRWRVRAKYGAEWAVGGDVVVEASGSSGGPSVVASVEDDVADVFFARAVGVFGDGQLKAAHSGVKGAWDGTGERAAIGGRNRFGDVFAGSEDATVLLLTDDGGGDALFADDVITESMNGLAEQQARLSRLDAIYAGDGDDIIDLTSQRFDYIGGGLSVHGGLGDDVIWANSGDNLLFGDAGNDRIVGAGGNDVIVGGSGDDSLHGGGGEDIFAFGGNWGNDNVEQLADGKVTLWFREGSPENWNEATLTYQDGDKSVKVSGVAAENVTLKFGGDGSQQYGKLLEAGAFDGFSSERIFENRNTRGMLA